MEAILTLDKRSAVGRDSNRQHQTSTNMTKHLSIQKLIAALLTIVAIATGQTARALDLTVTPDEDYYIGTVTWNEGTDHVITPTNSGGYSFTMPQHDVTVSATFLDDVGDNWGEGNDGSEEHPYVISDQAGWDYLVLMSNTISNTNGKHFRLDTDLVNVTQSLSFFCGHLDGNHHTISINMTYEGCGLIDVSYYGCTISNLTVEGSIENPAAIVGGFIARSAMIDNTITLTDCRSNVTINSNYTGSSTEHYYGGFVGQAYNVECVRCVFDGAFVSSTTFGFGGLVGWCRQLSVTDCAVVFGSATSLTNEGGANFSFADCNNNNITEQGHNFYFNKGYIFGGIQPNGGTPVYPLTLTNPAAAVRTGGIRIGDRSATIYADGFNPDGTEYYAADATVTLSAPAVVTAVVSIAAAQYNDGSNHAATINPDGTASFTMPAAATTATITGFEANYIDADGTEQTHAVSLLSSSNGTVNKAGGWYAVIGNVTIGSLHFNGETHLILTDGATLTVNACTFVNNNLYVYGQTLGTGTLYTHHETVPAALLGEVNYAYGMKVTGNITFCGGQVKAWAVAKPKMTPLDEGSVIGYGIYANGNVTIIRGHLYASAGKTHNSAAGKLYFIIANDIILDWRLPTDRIFITNLDINISGSNIVLPKDYCYSNMRVADGKALWNGEKVLSDTIYDSNSDFIDQMNFVNKTLQPCITREVAGYEESTASDHWAFIASPVTGSISPTSVVGLVASTATKYDLYRFNQSAALEWENYKAHSSDFNLVNGQGYLYATKETKTLAFMGDTFNMGTEDVEVPLVYDEGKPLAGWNLVGNPFTVSATLTQPYYRMNAEGSALKTETETSAVAAMEGVFVQATAANQTVTFTAQTRGGEKTAIAQANIMVVGNNGAVIDNAIVRFDGGQTLEKFSFREGSTKIYIPQDGTDYAIVTSEGQGEMPLNFKAETDGTYTISVDVDNVNLAYLHLIDNITGADIDLLAANGGDARPCVSTYTFTAKTTDYESRFKLVFSICEDANGDNAPFAFISNGNLIVNGEGTLQMVDVTGRIVLSVGGHTRCVPTTGMTAGVYILRLITGNDVKTQKIVVE